MFRVGAFGAVVAGVQKWIFFILAICAGGGLFGTMYLMVKENINKFPEDARYLLRMCSGLFFLSWGTFPVLWVLGAPGLNILSQEYDVALHALADFISKNLFGFTAWYVRWNLLNVRMDDNGKVILTKKRAITAKLQAKAAQGGTTLTEEDISEARKKPFSVLLLTSNSLVYKLMNMMMEKVGVKIHTAPNISTARTIMSSFPADNFDAVIVVPGNSSKVETKELREFSEFICKPPYKIPMLGVFFDDEHREEEPGYFIHGIIPRPLDEYAVKAALLEWRLTSLMWKRVADSVEAIEGYQQNPAMRKKPGANGNVFGNQLMPGLIQSTNDQGADKRKPMQASGSAVSGTAAQGFGPIFPAQRMQLPQTMPAQMMSTQFQGTGGVTNNGVSMNMNGQYMAQHPMQQSATLAPQTYVRMQPIQVMQHPNQPGQTLQQASSHTPGHTPSQTPSQTPAHTPAHTPANSPPGSPRQEESTQNQDQDQGQGRVRFA